MVALEPFCQLFLILIWANNKINSRVNESFVSKVSIFLTSRCVLHQNTCKGFMVVKKTLLALVIKVYVSIKIIIAFSFQGQTNQLKPNTNTRNIDLDFISIPSINFLVLSLVHRCM